MKKAKKLLSLVLAIIMIVSTVPVAFATEGSYDKVELGVTGTVSLTEENPYQYVEFTPTETSVYVVSSNNNIDNSDPKVYVFDSNFEEIAVNDDGGEGSNFRCSFNAEAGETYYIQLTSYDEAAAVYDYIVEVVKMPVSIEGFAENDLIEHLDGVMCTDSLFDDNGEYLGESEEYFYYDESDVYVNFILTYEDGSDALCSKWDIEDWFGVDVIYETTQSYETPWGVGTHEMMAYVLDFEVPIEVTIVENPVDYVVAEDITLIQNFDGGWYTDEEGNDIFMYSYTPRYTVVMKDGTKYKSDVDGDIRYNETWYSMYCDDDQYDNAWGIGKHEVTGEILGYEVDFTVEVIECPIKNIKLTPERSPIIGIDSAESFNEYVDFVAEIEFKDGSKDKCLVKDIYDKYNYEFDMAGAAMMSDNYAVGVYNFMGYQGEYELNFIANPYKSITISGDKELVLTFNKVDGTSVTTEIIDYYTCYEVNGEAYLFAETELGTFPTTIYWYYDEVEGYNYPCENIAVQIGEMKSNTLEENCWFYSYEFFKFAYYKISMYQLYCDDYYNREFAGLDIPNSNYDVTDLGNIADLFWYVEPMGYEDIEVDGDTLSYYIYDADDVANNIEMSFNISNVDITKHAGYHSEENTVWIPDFGFGDLPFDYQYKFEYVDGKYIGTVEYYDTFTGNTEYVEIIFDARNQYIEKVSFNTKNVNLNGWVQENGKWAYYQNGTKLKSQWKQDSKGWCYLGADGYMVTNDWVKDSQGWCYIGNSGYIIYNQWVSHNGKWYFVNAKGYRVSNQWVKDSKGWCYLGADGAMLTNAWKKDSKGWCYIGSAGYIVSNQWVQDNGKWYFIDASGYMVANQWKKDSNGWCYLGANGAMATNAWVKDSVGWCYIGADGYCVTNEWVKDSKGWCYLDSNGRMVYNKWVKDSKGWCYVGSSGYMVYNQWVQDGGKWYYLDGNGYMVTGTKVINGKTYKFDSNGVWIG